MRRAVVLVALFLVPLAHTGAASATRECNGLDVCISVPGPWVAVPAAPADRVQTVYYQLTCPARSIVGGLDAVLGNRSLDVRFLGSLGSPVNPGITTGRSVVFVATYARGSPTVFRPLLGCIPTSGGGGRGTTSLTPAALVRVAAPIRPLVRRVRTLRVRPARTNRLVLRCASGERLVGSSHAIAFRVRRKPAGAAIRGVTAARTDRGGRVEVRARRLAGLQSGTRVEVQVHALCAGGPR